MPSGNQPGRSVLLGLSPEGLHLFCDQQQGRRFCQGLLLLAQLLLEPFDRGDFGPPEQGGQLTSDERAELARLRKENRELRREKDFFRLAAAHFAKEQLPPGGFG